MISGARYQRVATYPVISSSVCLAKPKSSIYWEQTFLFARWWKKSGTCGLDCRLLVPSAHSLHSRPHYWALGPKTGTDMRGKIWACLKRKPASCKSQKFNRQINYLCVLNQYFLKLGTHSVDQSCWMDILFTIRWGRVGGQGEERT